MKKFFLPLLASFALPSAVNAETWWLMAGGKLNGAPLTAPVSWSIPTNSEQECEFAGQKFLIADFPNVIGDKSRGYVCVKGK